MWNWIKYESKFLGKSHCHLQNEAFAIVRGEEGRKNIMLEKGNTMDRSALAISKPSGNEGSAVANAANSGRNERKKTSEKDSLWCSYCKKNRHTRETCWKLHGKYSFSLSASKIQFSSPWIIDSRASDHMTNSSKVFSNYIPCPGNQKIKIADGTLVTVDLLTRKVIRHAREEGGLFFLEVDSGTTCPTPHTNKKSFVPFSLFHMDVWGPTKVHSIYGGEPFAEDKEFFPSLPTLPILENSTKTVQTKGSDFSMAVTPENTKKTAPENASNTAPVMPDFSIAVTSENTQAIAPENASETAPEAVPELPRSESYMQSSEGEDLQVLLKVYSRRKQLAPETPHVPVIQPEKGTNSIDLDAQKKGNDFLCLNDLDLPIGKKKDNQLDVKNALLHGDLEEEVYMEVPLGLEEKFEQGKVCKLKKVIALIVYVDNIVLTGNDPAEMEKLKWRLAKEFEIKDLGKLKYFLGTEVAHFNEGIIISQ
ncbi:hypothetical protein CK203_082363 [Vitis vinifera]|uniref:Uncharacterized protein n=1 Tax=Vitis vinifera TaxID=29760 RepID=A0A438DSG6_VITVI|nr:hypothetical protein CK203_082363 [Vitis vinifera]